MADLARRRAYDARRARAIAYGTWQPWGDIDAVQTHIRTLLAQGRTLRSISFDAGLPEAACGQVMRASRVTSARAEAILSVRPGYPRTGRVPPHSACRRLRALAAVGWGLREVSERTGLTTQALERMRRGAQSWLYAETHWEIVRVYDELSMCPPPMHRGARRTANHARHMGWVSPLAWDDDLIDLPDADLDAELRRRAEEMPQAEVNRCHRARRQGDRSPLILAGAQEYQRRRKAKEKARRGVAA